MASSCSSSTSSLCDVESLRARLEEKDQILRTSAQYGKDLLDQNRDLTQTIDDITNRFTRQLEVLKEENYSLTQRLEHKERMEMEYQDEIDSLKKHLTSQRDELRVLNELTDQSQLISELRNRIREMEAVSDKSDLDNKQLSSLVESYREQLEEANKRLAGLQEVDTSTDELSTLLRELQEVKSKKEESQRKCVLHKNEIHHLTQQLESHLSQISELQEELMSANSQLSSLSNSFMASSQENQELRCEIDMLRMNDRDHKTKGNSMFTELDDKRKEAEKKLLLLNVQYESLGEQYDLSKKQMSKLKLQMSNILRMASGQVDSAHVAELETQLAEARGQVRTLTTKLSKLSTTEGSAMPQSFKDSNDAVTLRFVENLLASKDEELKVLKKELEEKRLASAYNVQQLDDAQYKLRNMESKASQLQAQNIQLSVKLEDLKAKYEVETSTDTRLLREREEDIPDFNPELANALLGTGVGDVATHQETENIENSFTSCDRLSIAPSDRLSTAPSDRLSTAPSDLSDTETVASSDIHSLCEIPQNIDSSQADGQSPLRQRRTRDLYVEKEVMSQMSSTDSLWRDGQVNAKSYDNSATQSLGEEKVIKVEAIEHDANGCPTQ